MDKRDALNRLRSASGHVAALSAMIERDAPCTDVLRQVQAVRGALCAINGELLRAYLLTEDCRLRSRDKGARYRAWRELCGVIGGEPKA